MEHQQSLGGQPHQTDQCEVVDQGRDSHTHGKQLHLSNTGDKAYQHQNHRDTELDTKNSTVTVTKFPVLREREKEWEGERESKEGNKCTYPLQYMYIVVVIIIE